jgi:hypothetical protein
MYVIFDIDACILEAHRDIDNVMSVITSNPRYLKLRQRFAELNIPFRGVNINMAIFWRPYFKEFVEYCYQEGFKVAVWSAGEPEYVKACVESMFKGLRAQPIIVLDSTHKVMIGKNNYHKPLDVFFARVPGANVKNTILIDDRLENFLHYPTNGVNIPVYSVNLKNHNPSERDDDAFLKIWRWMESTQFKSCSDVRTLDKKEIFATRNGNEQLVIEHPYDTKKRLPLSIKRRPAATVVVSV